MGNKSSSAKDGAGESRGRSRSFTGFASKFRKASRSPPRERSSSLSETKSPKKGPSSKSGQNGLVKGNHNGHVQNGIDPPRSVPLRKKVEHTKSDTSALLRPRSRNSGEIAVSVLTGTFSKPLQDNQRLTLPQYSTSVATLECGRDKTPEKKIIADYESPRMSAAQMRQISQDFYGGHIEEISKRRGMANLNRDLSLSQASLSYLSTKSKSLHSLTSIDLDDDLAKVRNLDNGGWSMSKQHQVNIDHNYLINNPGIQTLEHYDTEPMMRPRTNSTSAIELGHRGRKYVAMGATSAALRRQLQQGNSPGKQESEYQAPKLKNDEALQAQRALVARALKLEEMPSNVPQEDMTVTSAYVSHPYSLPLVDSFRTSPSPVSMNSRSVSPVSGQLRTESPERMSSLRSLDNKSSRSQALRLSPVRKPLPDIDEHKILSSSVPVVSGAYMPAGRPRLRSKDDGDISQILEQSEYGMRERSRSFTSNLSQAGKPNLGLLSRHGASVPCFGNNSDLLRNIIYLNSFEEDSAYVNRAMSYSTNSLSDMFVDLPNEIDAKHIPGEYVEYM